jgi:hypothetical protein
MATRRAGPLGGLALGVALAVGCANGDHHSDGGHHADSVPSVVAAREVIERHQRGATEAALLEVVNDPSRTFDLTESDVADMVGAGVSTKVVDAALAKSDAHHRESGHGGPDGHGHSHGHQH